MGLLDTLGLSGLQQRAQQFSTNPLGMASLGLLLQPRRRKIGEGGFQAALQGMEAAAANRQAKAYEESLKRQDELRKKQYTLDALQYGYGRAEAAAAQAEKDRALAAEQAYLASRPPEERTVAEAMGVPAYAKMRLEMENPTTAAVSGALGRYQAAKNDPNNPFTGTLQQWMEYEASLRPEPAPNIQFIPTAQGIVAGDTRTGIPRMVLPGVLPAAVSPEVIGKGAEARAAGTVTGTTRTQAAFDLPDIEAKADYASNLIDQLLSHPGMPGVVGAPSAGKLMAGIPGSPESGFKELFDQIGGQQFLQAIDTLRGTGQITELEGTTAKKSVSRMSTAQSEAEFIAAANEYKQVIELGRARARARAGVAPQSGNATMTPGGMPVNTDMQSGGYQLSPAGQAAFEKYAR